MSKISIEMNAIKFENKFPLKICCSPNYMEQGCNFVLVNCLINYYPVF